jgi:hypothetical protein
VQAKRVPTLIHDDCEREADRVATEISSRPGEQISAPIRARPGTAGRGMPYSLPHDEREEENDDIVADESGMPKRDGGAAAGVGPVNLPDDGGAPIGAGERAFFEPRLGHDFSNVRVHADARAGRAVASAGALAVTVGRHIYFGPGRYQPGAASGRALVAHELTHVVQQAGHPGLVAAQPACPQGKQKAVTHNDCSNSAAANPNDFIRHLEVDVAAQTVRADWADASGTATRTTSYACSPNPNVTPRGADRVGVKCSNNHTNMHRDGMAWFTGFRSTGMRIGFHDSQRVGPGIHSHGCVRVSCVAAREINANTSSGVTTINVGPAPTSHHGRHGHHARP